MYENAQVYGNAKVLDKARIYGDSIIKDNVCVYDVARVFGNANIYENAKVYGVAYIDNYAKVHGKAKIYDSAKVNDKLIDKECFKIDNGYRPKYAVYRGYNEKYNIDGNYFAYLGDNDLCVCFYKCSMLILKGEKVLYSSWNHLFSSETFYVDGVKFNVSWINKDWITHIDNDNQTWEEYIRENWRNATGKEKYYELQAGKSALRRFRRLRKRKNRPNKWDRNRPNKFCAKWEHNGNKYEIVFGYGIPWSKKEYLSMKKDNVFDKYYNYTKDEIKKVEEMYNR